MLSAVSIIALNISQLDSDGRMPRGLERGDHVVLRLTIELLPQLARRAHDRVREERRVNERLSAASEVQNVGRARVRCGAETSPGQVGVALPQLALRRRLAAQLQPRRDPGE